MKKYEAPTIDVIGVASKLIQGSPKNPTTDGVPGLSMPIDTLQPLMED
jgi:hypothetical protein